MLGVMIYLGNSGNSSNMKLVVEMLKEAQLNVFSGMSLGLGLRHREVYH